MTVYLVYHTCWLDCVITITGKAHCKTKLLYGSKRTLVAIQTLLATFSCLTGRLTNRCIKPYILFKQWMNWFGCDFDCCNLQQLCLARQTLNFVFTLTKLLQIQLLVNLNFNIFYIPFPSVRMMFGKNGNLKPDRVNKKAMAVRPLHLLYCEYAPVPIFF